MVSASVVALAYDRYVSAVWRGEGTTASSFATWLESFWRVPALPEPGHGPDGVSFCGGRGGLRWYDTTAGILGYVPGRPNGCYHVDPAAEPPALPSPADDRTSLPATALLAADLHHGAPLAP